MTASSHGETKSLQRDLLAFAMQLHVPSAAPNPPLFPTRSALACRFGEAFATAIPQPNLENNRTSLSLSPIAANDVGRDFINDAAFIIPARFPVNGSWRNIHTGFRDFRAEIEIHSVDDGVDLLFELQFRPCVRWNWEKTTPGKMHCECALL